MGAITEVVRRYVPATYREMISVTLESQRLFSTVDLQALADYVKFRLFATVVTEAEEATAYNPMQKQFIGKLTTLQFIPAAIDFWDSKLASKRTTGTSEVVQYRDNRQGLVELFEMLSKQVKDDAVELGVTHTTNSWLPGITYGDNGRGILITEDPQDFPGLNDYIPSYLLPWSVNG